MEPLEVESIDRDELMRILDDRARRYLGMSGEEFLDALDRGDLPDSSVVVHLAMLAGAK